MRPAEAVVGAFPRVMALKIVVFPDWGSPIIPSFILTLSMGVVYLRSLEPKWRNRQTRTTQNRVPSGNEGSIPSFGTRIIPYGYFTQEVILHWQRPPYFGGRLIFIYTLPYKVDPGILEL